MMERIVIILSLCLTLPTFSLAVISGDTIIPHSMPYVAGLKITGNTSRILCGGTLVSQNYILTAASCTTNTESIEVVLGAHYLNKTEKTQVHVVVNKSNFKRHPHFNETTLENDIALLKLPKPVKLNGNVNVIKIATELDVENLNMTGQWSISAGWGYVTSIYKIYGDYLESLWMNIIDNGNSDLEKWFPGKVKDTNICTAGYTTTQSSANICEGDFGGPLVLNRTKFLIGIGSFTFKNCAMGTPNVFTRVMKYTSWIAANSDVKFDDNK